MGSSSSKAQSEDRSIPVVLHLPAKSIERYTGIMERLRSVASVKVANKALYKHTESEVKGLPFPENCRQMELSHEFRAHDKAHRDSSSHSQLLWSLVRALGKAEVDQPAAWLSLGHTVTVSGQSQPLSVVRFSFGTWLKPGQFANVQQFGNNRSTGVGQFLIEPAGSITEYIKLYVKAGGIIVCLKIAVSTLCNPLVLSENDEGLREIYLRLKTPPLISMATNIQESGVGRGPDNLQWRRYHEITKGSRHVIGACDVINIVFAPVADPMTLIQYLVSSPDKVHFMPVKQRTWQGELSRSKHIETAVRNVQNLDAQAMDCWSIYYAFQVLQSRGLKLEVKLTDTFVKTLIGVATTNMDVFEKMIAGLAQYADSGKELHLLDLDKVDREMLIGLGPVTHARRKVDRNRRRICNALVTPTRILFELPKPESNRIIRAHYPDSILRLSFRDEDNGQLSNLNYSKEVFSDDSELLSFTVAERLRGIAVYGRHFEYLGGSKSLTKAHGCYMYAKDRRGFTAQTIRDSIGDLSHIRCPATYMCRLGLAFTTSDTSFPVDGREVIPDITKNGYCFSDGIGKISQMLAKKV